MPDQSEVHDVLVRARNLIGRDGWMQGRCRPSWQDRRAPDSGPFCLFGATLEATGQPREWDAALDELRLIVGENVVEWNDAPGRTKAEVLAAFDRAIAATAPPPPDFPTPTPENERELSRV